MNYTFMKEATEYVNSLPKITDMKDASFFAGGNKTAKNKFPV